MNMTTMTSKPPSRSFRPTLCVWEITDACNLRCVHCIVSAGQKGPSELTTDEALRLVDQLADAGCETVALSGGEPLVRPDWPQLAGQVVARGMKAVLATNGLLADDGAIAQMTASGISSAAVSLDGSETTHNAVRGKGIYTGTIAAIERLVASPMETAVMTQVHKDNLDELDDLYHTIVALGVDRWQLQIAVPAGRMLALDRAYLIQVDDIARLADTIAEFSDRGEIRVTASDNIGYYGRSEPKLRKTPGGKPLFWTGCQAGQRLVGIAANGDVKGCPSLPREFVAGNVRQTPFIDIWKDDDGFAYTRRFDDNHLEGGCAKCPLAPICKAGCTCMAYMVTGTVYDNPFCIQRA